MKQLFTLLIAIFLPLFSYADKSGTCGEKLSYTYVESTQTLTITGNGAMSGYNSNYPQAPWSYYKTDIKNIIIDEGVTSIGSHAFADCVSLTSITIPASVTNIGWSAFDCCTALISVRITDLAAWCNIYFGEYGSSYGYNNPLYYAHHLYLNEEEIKDLVIPSSVTRINDYIFKGCTGLTSLSIPNSVTSIGKGAFSLCSGLTSLSIPNSVKSIGISAFERCSSLATVTIPNSVTSIGISAFESCSHLASVTIPNSVTSIGAWAFKDCRGLTSVTIPNSVTAIASGAFEGCSGIEKLNVDCREIKKDNFNSCKANLKEINLGTNVENIEEDSFKDFTSLQRCSFGSVESLLRIKFGNAVANPLSITKVLNVNSKVVTELVIPESVTTINDYALYNCNSIKKMIGGGQLTNIGKYAFYNNVKLSSIQIGSKVESIGNYAFKDCIMTQIYNYAEYPQSCASNVFSIVKENCKLYVQPESVDLYKVHQDWYEFNIMAMDDEALPVESIRQLNHSQFNDYYDLSGRKLSKLQRGIHVLHMSDGTTRKVLIK